MDVALQQRVIATRRTIHAFDLRLPGGLLAKTR
jgi:hypothetical protein